MKREGYSLVLVGILILFSMTFLSADFSIGTVSQGSTIQLTQLCSNCTYVNLTQVLYPNQSYALLGQYSMTQNGNNYNYSWNDTQTLGTYFYTTCGNLNGVNTCQSVSFIVSPNGQNFTTGNAISYIGFIVILLFTFILTMWGAIKIKWVHRRDDENKVISVNNLRYVKVFLFSMTYIELMFLFGLSYKFFSEANIQGFTNFFYYAYQVFLSLLYPIIIFTVIIFFVIFLTNRKIKSNLDLGI